MDCKCSVRFYCESEWVLEIGMTGIRFIFAITRCMEGLGLKSSFSQLTSLRGFFLKDVPSEIPKYIVNVRSVFCES